MVKGVRMWPCGWASLWLWRVGEVSSSPQWTEEWILFSIAMNLLWRPLTEPMSGLHLDETGSMSNQIGEALWLWV